MQTSGKVRTLSLSTKKNYFQTHDILSDRNYKKIVSCRGKVKSVQDMVIKMTSKYINANKMFIKLG